MKPLFSLTPQFHVDALRAQHEYAPLGRCSARISCRSAAEHKYGVTITFYQLQKGCDHHILSAAERPTAVNKWPYLHVDQLPSNFTALYLMNNFDHHVPAANR